MDIHGLVKLLTENEVLQVQKAMNLWLRAKATDLVPLVEDGKYGAKTEEVLKRFFLKEGVSPNLKGFASAMTALNSYLPDSDIQPPDTPTESDFRGDPDFLLGEEGFVGHAYVIAKSSSSGVTFDPGVDVGHCGIEFFRNVYSGVYSDDTISFFEKIGIFGKKGVDAVMFYNRHKKEMVESSAISKAQVRMIAMKAFLPYWDEISKRFPTLKELSTPACVQTVMLSLSYNRGAWNKNLGVLTELINARRWKQVAECISGMQQNHPLKAIRDRRKREGKYILDRL